MKLKLYFAYGADLNLKIMSDICPAALRGPVCVMPNYSPAFRGPAGSGLLTVEPQAGSRVPGLLWKITPADEAALDRLHGVPDRYRKRRVTLETKEGPMLATAHVLLDGFPLAAPPNRYLSTIRTGYSHNAMEGGALKQALSAFSDMPGSSKHGWCPLERKPCPYAKEEEDPGAWSAFICGAVTEDLMLC